MTRDRQLKDLVYEQFARIGKALSSPKRIELLDVLSQGSRHVEALSSLTGLSIANASQHLQVLKAARLVESERMGVQVAYRLASPSVGGFVRGLRLLAEERLAEIDQTVGTFLKDRERFDPVDREELLRRVRRGEVTVLDVRPEEEYRSGHLRGALSVPLANIKARMKDLPEGRDVVAYCRGPYCLMAVEAAEKLRAKGFRAYRLDLSVTDWRALGFKIEGAPGTR
ncbi:MAG: metalloregulator ArsR/SmtB family transcription factor [Candidatus Hydrogenedentes bacterium]|nr:metalloregulator ArsR/SmtB family transcription factor [Candidatus Hydrogenedentota bacterium]